MNRRPRQVVPPIQQVPSRCTAATTASVRRVVTEADQHLVQHHVVGRPRSPAAVKGVGEPPGQCAAPVDQLGDAGRARARVTAAHTASPRARRDDSAVKSAADRHAAGTDQVRRRCTTSRPRARPVASTARTPSRRARSATCARRTPRSRPAPRRPPGAGAPGWPRPTARTRRPRAPTRRARAPARTPPAGRRTRRCSRCRPAGRRSAGRRHRLAPARVRRSWTSIAPFGPARTGSITSVPEAEQPQRAVDRRVPLGTGQHPDRRRAEQPAPLDVPAGLREHVVPGRWPARRCWPPGRR